MSDKRNRLIAGRIRDAEKSSERLSGRRAAWAAAAAHYDGVDSEDMADMDTVESFTDKPHPKI